VPVVVQVEAFPTGDPPEQAPDGEVAPDEG
jgi:hypothetical protein